MSQNESLLTPQTANAGSITEADSDSSADVDSVNQPLKHSFLISLGLLAAFLCISIFICGRPTYETNDDVVMSMLAAGVGFVDKPNEHLLYSHFIVGKLLNWLYTQNSHVAWYSVYLFFSQCLSMLSMVNIIIRRANKKTLLYILPLFFFAVCLRPTQYMQFTTTAALVSTAGSLYLFEALEKKNNFKNSLPLLLLSSLFFLGGSLIRFQSARAIVVLAGLFLFTHLFARFDLSKLKIAIPFLLIIAAGISGLEYQNINYYKHDKWHEFYDLNYPRFRLTEFGRTNKLTPPIVSAFKQVGWSPADDWMLARFYLLDQNNFSLEKLRKLDSLVPEVKRTNPAEVLSELATIMMRLTILPILVAIVLSCLLVDKSKKSWLSGGAFAVGLVCASIFLLITMKLPVYVFAGLASCSCASLLWAASSLREFRFRELSRLHRVAALGLLICFSVSACISATKFHKESERTAMQSEILRTQFANLAPQYLYVIWAYAFPYSAIRPFDDLHSYFAGLKLLGINFLSRTPANTDRLQEFGITDLMKQFDSKQIRLISNSEFNVKIHEYIEQHYSKDVTFACLNNFEKIGFSVFKVECRNAPEMLKNLNQQWCEYIAKMSGFQPGSGGDIVVSDSLDCHVPNAQLDEVFYPSDKHVWKLIDIKDASTKRSLSFFKSPPVERCVQCKMQTVPTRDFENSGNFPTLSYYGNLNLDPSDYSAFFIEVAAPQNMQENRAVMVEFNLPSAHKWKFIIPLQIDSSLHRYEFRLSKLNFSSADRITNMNVHPVYLRNQGEKERFELGQFGFVKNSKVLR